ncbi:MAG: molybdopterin oxidoreductase family protein [Caldilineaceae bacterium]|nr:molybdopterin oxidoreductase family protein [Caldilineaceae bacterium]MCY4091661.1 molybdopterin oxidoreductase family protein [Caldilineaceae bacterium]
MPNPALYRNDPTVRIVTGACPHDCPDTCSWQIAVDRKDGRALDIWGHPDHPVTQGTLCGKVDRYLERVYHADRLRHPQRRVGPKGSGRFERISWNEALAGIAARLREIIDAWGAEAVLPYSYAGTMGWLQQHGMSDRFFQQMGASRLARTICSEAGFEGYLYTIGSTIGIEPEDFAHARLILIWGSNTLTSNLHLWPFIQAARKQDARVIVIDPARTRTARAADEWLPLRPGTDGALALALMHEIIDAGLHDGDYVAAYTVGFEQLAQRVQEWTPQRAAEITGIPAERISRLAREYATTRPAAIRVNYGMQRHYGGGMAMRNITCLPALVGAWRERGGGIQLSTSGQLRQLETTGLQRPDLQQGRIPRTINMNRLGDALSLDRTRLAAAHYAPRPVDRKPSPAAAGPPVKALIVYNSNPAAVTPDQAAVQAGLAREDLFTVVLEHFQTDTADYADYLLPATTQAEHWDLQRMYGHHYLALNRPAITPVAETRPNSAIFRGLAQAMGYTDSAFYEDDETVLRNFVAAQNHPLYEPVTWDALLEKGFVRLNLPQPFLPFAQGNFPTPSGKCEFYSERMARDGYDPLPTYTPPNSVAGGQWTLAGGNGEERANGARGARAVDSTLACISPPAHSFLNSSFSNLERFRGREKEPLLWIHPQDASVRRIDDGARLRVWNGLGEVRLTARVTDDIMAGTVLAPGIWWNKHSVDGRNVNQLTPQDETDMGASGSFYDVRVHVERV